MTFHSVLGADFFQQFTNIDFFWISQNQDFHVFYTSDLACVILSTPSISAGSAQKKPLKVQRF
ncbi:MAG: hypothetical protein BGO40_07480 [Chryseobacterium sp. 39-10]|nr:MAG: hypothetical protein BGO40_07480 [Chryseobacterium sp. 39-10]